MTKYNSTLSQYITLEIADGYIQEEKVGIFGEKRKKREKRDSKMKPVYLLSPTLVKWIST